MYGTMIINLLFRLPFNRYIIVTVRCHIFFSQRDKTRVLRCKDKNSAFLQQFIAQVLGVSISSAYELMHETGFPALRIGNRIVVPKEKFCRWVDAQTGGDT